MFDVFLPISFKEMIYTTSHFLSVQCVLCFYTAKNIYIFYLKINMPVKWIVFYVFAMSDCPFWLFSLTWNCQILSRISFFLITPNSREPRNWNLWGVGPVTFRRHFTRINLTSCSPKGGMSTKSLSKKMLWCIFFFCPDGKGILLK